MSDIRKLLNTISEMAVTSGSVATVAKPMGGMARRSKDSIFYEGSACETCGCEPCKCDTGNTVDGTKTPDAPKASEFGRWENSALTGKKKKQVKEAAEPVQAARDMWDNEMDRPGVQQGIKKMAARHKDEKWSTEQLSALGQRLAAAGKKSKIDELECGQGQRQLDLAEVKSPDKNDPWEQGWEAGSRAFEPNPYKPGTPEHGAWQAGYDERGAQPNHYDESADFKNLKAMEKHREEEFQPFVDKQVKAAKNTLDEKRTEVKDKSGKVVSWKDESQWEKTAKKDPRGKVTHMSDVARRETEKLKDVKEGEDLAWDDPDLAMARKFMAAKAKKKPVVIKPRDEIGFRVADIGPGGKESNVRTDAAWDKKAKK